MRLTVGPLPPSVYWRRRALVLGAALLVLFLVAQACMAATAAPGGDTDGSEDNGTPPGPTGSPALSAASTATPRDETADPGDDAGPDDRSTSRVATGDDCRDEDMQIGAEADRTSFAAGEPVTFTIRIRNGSNRTCVRDIGGDQRELYLIQGTGANRVWSTRHCGAPTGQDEAELVAGFETRHFIVWNGRTSSTCDGEGRPAGPMVTPGDYQLFARLGTAHSEPLELTISGS